MVFSRSARFVLVILIGLALLAAGTAQIMSPSHRLQYIQEGEGPLDLNKASFTELLRLPGIGPTLAERIVLYRQRHGPFRTLEELLSVKGIGPKLLDRLRERLRVGESAGDHQP